MQLVKAVGEFPLGMNKTYLSLSRQVCPIGADVVDTILLLNTGAMVTLHLGYWATKQDLERSHSRSLTLALMIPWFWQIRPA